MFYIPGCLFSLGHSHSGLGVVFKNIGDYFREIKQKALVWKKIAIIRVWLLLKIIYLKTIASTKERIRYKWKRKK